MNEKEPKFTLIYWIAAILMIIIFGAITFSIQIMSHSMYGAIKTIERIIE